MRIRHILQKRSKRPGVAPRCLAMSKTVHIRPLIHRINLADAKLHTFIVCERQCFSPFVPVARLAEQQGMDGKIEQHTETNEKYHPKNQQGEPSQGIKHAHHSPEGNKVAAFRRCSSTTKKARLRKTCETMSCIMFYSITPSRSLSKALTFFRPMLFQVWPQRLKGSMMFYSSMAHVFNCSHNQAGC